MTTIREKKPGVWEVRVFTGRDARRRPTQISRTVRGGKRDAQRLAVQLEGGPGRATAPGRTVADVLDAWIGHNSDTWAPSSARDQRSRVKALKLDEALARTPVARRSVADVERWHARLRRAGKQDAGTRPASPNRGRTPAAARCPRGELDRGWNSAASHPRRPALDGRARRSDARDVRTRPCPLRGPDPEPGLSP